MPLPHTTSTSDEAEPFLLTEEFLITEELDTAIQAAVKALAGSKRTISLTGAGLSVESGIPPFRGPGGLWSKYGEPPMDGYQRFLENPRKHWEERLEPTMPWAIGLRETLMSAKPNTGHRALAELERLGCCACVITQNVDDLHNQAGSKSVLEIHGNHFLMRCIECHTRYRDGQIAVDPENLPPLCTSCGGVVKGDTVQFGEPIPPDVLRRCYEEVELADCMIVAGTSATVFPAAQFPVEILGRGGCVIEVNPEPTDLTRGSSHFLKGPAGAVFERLLHHVRILQEEKPS